jgi:hypothetical protein
MGKLYAIAVLDTCVLRDFKLSKLNEQTEDIVPHWDKLLKIVLNNAYYRNNRAINTQFGKYRENLSSVTRWKTKRGAENALARLQKNQKAIEQLKKRLGNNPGFLVLDITEDWNETVSVEIKLEEARHSRLIKRLKNKLI